jgi:type IV secretion system protein VirB10
MRKPKQPAIEKPSGGQDDAEAQGTIRPIVRLARGGMSTGGIAVIVGVAALVLFSALERHRRTPAQAAIWSAENPVGSSVSDPPPLRLAGAPAAIVPVSLVATEGASGGAPIPPPPQVIRAYYARGEQASAPPAPPPAYYPPPTPPPPAPTGQPSRGSGGSPLVIDTTASNGSGAGLATPAGATSGAPAGSARSRSGMLANRAMTVPQGTLIPAVLETAFDSTHPGFARAIVSRDVRGFDGSRILIPRGSGLVGEYHSDVAPGQKRATIIWTRLLRPDGATVELDSPAVDPMGRGGVHASVNNHIPARVLNTLLQSSFAIGTALATRVASGSVVVALPAMQGAMGQQAQSAPMMPTLKVPAGTSISIFVARDLEFGGDTRE